MRKRIALLLAAATLGLSAAGANAQSAKEYVDIEAQSAKSALLLLGEQLGAQISVSSEIDESTELPSIQGEFTLEEALAHLLDDSGLAWRFVSEYSVIVSQADTGAPEDDTPADDGANALQELPADVGPVEFRALVVTGSKLQINPGQLDRQVTTYTRTDIDASAATNLEEFLRDIPQNIDAPTSNGAAFAGSFGSSGNFFGAAGVNLRGLSARATLVLIDGKRTARGGVLGEIVDINTIPLSMVDRIEVIFDGASSLYGADAVGGVVNIITRKDYQGVSVGVTHVRPEQGGTSETVAEVGGSYSWASGSLTASYQYQTRDELTGDERDLRFATGLTVGVVPGSPPNVRANEIYDVRQGRFWLPPLFNLDASGNPAPLGDPSGVTPVFATQLPESSDGVVTIADLAGRTPTPASRPEAGLGLIPSRDDHAVRVSAQQELTGDLLLSGSITYTAGDTSSLEQNHTLSMWVGEASNPWAPNPWSPFPYSVYLDMELPFLPDTERFTNKKGLNVDIALDGRLSENWEWTLFGLRSRLDNDGQRFNVLDFRTAPCLGTPGSFLCSGRSAGLNVFRHPLFGLDSEQEFIDLFVIPTGNTVNESREEQYEFVLKGTLFEAWGGSARAHLSLTSRKEESYLADDTGTVNTRSIIDDVADISTRKFEQELARKTDSITAEINVPLVSSANSRPGIARLDATLSARYDDIESLGGRVDVQRTTYRPSYSNEVLSEGEPFTLKDDNISWSAGLVWRPVEWLAIRGNVNESFTTPPMAAYVLPTNRDISQNCWLRDANGDPAPCQPIIYVSGGNPELLPEYNRTRSVGLEIRPNAIPDLFLAVNLHFNRLVDRIGELNGPNIRTVADLTPERADLSIDEETGIIQQDRRVRNLGRVKISGADFDVSYRLDTRVGMLDARLHYGYLHENTWRQVDSCGEDSQHCFDSTDDDPINRVAAIPFIELDGRKVVASYPPVPRHRANLRLGWEWGGWRVDASWSYASSTLKETTRYDAVNFSTVESTSITKLAKPVDIVVSYDFDKANRAPGLLRGTRLRLSVPNVFQDETEYVITPQLAGDTLGIFDPIHSRPRGRTYTLSIRKRFDMM